MTILDCKPGQHVRITQTIDRRDRDWHATVEGVVEAVEMRKTESWFAHSKDNKYWLLRVRLRKHDGEVTIVNVDQLSRIEVLAGAPPR